MKKLTATRLRENIYSILDEIISGGIPVEVRRGKHLLRIVPVRKASKLSGLKKRRTMSCKPEDIVHLDWSGEWNELE